MQDLIINFLTHLVENVFLYLGLAFLALIVTKIISKFIEGFWTNFFKKRFEKWQENRAGRKRVIKGYNKFIKTVLSNNDIEAVAGKGKGKTTINNVITWARNDNKMQYIKKHKIYYEIMSPQTLSYIEEKEKAGFLPFVATNFDLVDKKTGLKNQDPLPYLRQDYPAFYGLNIGLTEMRSYLSKNLYRKSNSQLLKIAETFEKSRHLDYFITIDSLKEKDYYIGVRIGEPLLIYPQKTKYFLRIDHKISYLFLNVYNYMRRGFVGKIFYKRNKEKKHLLKDYYKKQKEFFVKFEPLKNIKVKCLVWGNIYKFVVPWDKYFLFKSKHFKDEFAKRFAKKQQIIQELEK